MLANLFWWAKRVLLIGLALTAAYFYARWHGERAAHANTRTAMATAALQSAADAATTTAQLQKDKDHALQTAAKRAQSHRADAHSARTELDRLRDQLTSARGGVPGESPAACTQRADAAADVLSQCATAYLDLAAIADRHASDARTLIEAWPK